MASSTAELVTQHIVEGHRARLSHGNDHDHALDAEIADALGPSSSNLVNRLRHIRAEAKVTTQGRFTTDDVHIAPAHAHGCDAGPSRLRRLQHSPPDTALTELCWRDGVLTWSRGCKVVRTFTFPEPILQAFWTWMEVDSPDPIERAPGKRPSSAAAPRSPADQQVAARTLLRTRGAFSALQRHRSHQSASGATNRDGLRASHDPESAHLERTLCIFFQQGLLLHIPRRGEEHRIDLPFRPARAFPMPVGLFIQRQTENEDVEIADRLQRQHRRFDDHRDASSSASGMGYPFPNVAASMLDPQTPDFGPYMPSGGDMDMDMDIDEDDEDQLASTILPMAFHLRRPFDELAQVDRYPQISESVNTSGGSDGAHFVHGPATPFTDVDEAIVFVSQCTEQSPLPVLVTASHRTRSIRIYAFSETPTRPMSTSIILSSRLAAGTQGSSDLPGSQSIDMKLDLVAAQDSSSAGPSTTARPDETGVDPQSSLARGIGRGLPSTRKSGRIELERRSSTKSVPMGRDPSGRSRRISAMHAGNNERRMASRADEVGALARDRTMNGNVSQTVDGLRRQSQALTQEAMLGELTNGNVSVRVPSSARLRRSSQAVRTPYAGPRTTTRQPGTAARTPAARTRLSMSMPRPDASIDNFDLTSYPAAGPSTGKLGAYEPEALDANDSSSRSAESDPLGGLADLDNFARSFATVALLEEIPAAGLNSADSCQKIDVKVARFSAASDSPVHLYISVPALGQTFCRLVRWRSFAAEGGRTRRALHSGKPEASSALPVLDTAMVAVLPSQGGVASGVVVVDPDNSLSLWIGPAGRGQGPLKLGAWRRWSIGRQRSPKNETLAISSTIRHVSSVQGTTLRLHFAEHDDAVQVDLDFEPRCSLTQRTLRLLSAMLPPGAYASLKGAWIANRFGLDKPQEQQGPPLPGQDWETLVQVLGGSSAVQSGAAEATGIAPLDRLAMSLSHAEEGDNDIFAGWRQLPAGEGPASSTNAAPKPVSLTSYDRRTVAAVLHLLAQESRLDSIAATSDLPRLVRLLVQVASACGLDSWLDYWKLVAPSSSQAPPACPVDGQTADPRAEANAAPFDVYETLSRQLKGKTKATIADLAREVARSVVPSATHEVLLDVCGRTSQLLELYALFAPVQGQAAPVAHRVVERMISLGVGHDEVRSLPLGLALPLLEAIRSSQLDPPMRWSAEAFRLVHRTDLAMHLLARTTGYSTDLEQAVSHKLLRTMPRRSHLDPLCALIFNRDFRLADVVRMLETTTVSTVHVPEVEDQPEAAVLEQHARAVAAITERTKAVPVGRGMLYMASRPFHATQKWHIPPLCLGVKVVPRGTLVEPDAKADAALFEWPEFHNGVASILEVCVPQGAKVDSKWIFSHLGEEPTAKHAGFLFGLGLTKHLPALTPVHVFRYLKARHNLLTIGFLLGLAAAAVGTGDPAARHLLGMQLVAFLPPGSAPLNLSILTQTAGLLAMGLVFLGSNHRWTASRMLQQIGAAESPIPDVQSQHREAYSLSAGLALGLIMLGKGRSDGMASLPDKRIVVKLEQLINGSLGDMQRSKRKPSAVKVELNPDLSLTSIPASVALGLIFLRSNRRDVADVLWLPTTDELLDYIRPDVLLVRVLARYLILWDDIRCSVEWIEGVLPEWMRVGRAKAGRELSEAAQLASINMKAGACFVMGLKYAGSHDARARACLLQQLAQLNRDAKTKALTYFSKIRQSALRAAADLVTVSLAAVVAGSGDLEVLRTLRMAHGDVDSERSYGSHMATHMAIGLLFLGGGRLTLGSSDSAIAALLIAFFPRFPGSSTDNRAHLQAFRHLWVLAAEPRLLIAKDVESGEAAAVPMRIQTRLDGSHIDETDQETAIRTSTLGFAPTLLPSLDRIVGVSTNTARYWPTSLQVADSRRPAGQPEHLFQVARTAPLDLGQGAAAGLGPSMDDLRELVHGFASGGKHEELVERLCGDVAAAREEATTAGAGFQALLRTIVMECLTLDKAYVLPIYLAMVLALELAPSAGEGAVATLNDLQFAESFYDDVFERVAAVAAMQAEGGPRAAAAAAAAEQPHRAPLVQLGLLSKILYTARQRGREAIDERPEAQRALAAFLERSESCAPATTTADGTGDALAFLWAAEGRPKIETMRELASLVRRAALDAVQQQQQQSGGGGGADDEGRRRAELVDALRTTARMAIQAYEATDEAEGEGDGARGAASARASAGRWSAYLVDKVVEIVVARALA
ncbi:related to negative regulator of mitosis [Pseudozyma flocculosa]|uniref:Related to negative regulator of mitosis n=1 Tax=Pseudozyma flocculosa TaxID=84751 RepID=A0A5C3EYB9_9BASI|nr:related to negative regulator of mitosis [Pseudozyma flocculosa]